MPVAQAKLTEEKERPFGPLFAFGSGRSLIFIRVPPATIVIASRWQVVCNGGTRMKKTLAVLATVAAIGAATITAPAPAEAHGIGPGLAFGLAAGAIAAGAAGAYGYYGPGYGYGYGPYYGPAYGPGYAYYGGPYVGPYWRHRYWRPY